MAILQKDDLAHQSAGRSRKALVGIFWSGLNSLLPAISGFVVFFLVSRVLGPAEFGVVAFSIAIVGAIGAFSPAGFGDALVQRQDLNQCHLNSTFWICIISSLVLYVFTIALAVLVINQLENKALGNLLPILGIRLFFDLATVVPTALLIRKMQFRKIAVRTLVASLLSMTVCLVILWFGYGIWALVMSQLASAVALCVVSWLSVEWRPSGRIAFGALIDIRSFGGFSSASRLINTINVSQILIGSVIGTAAIGLFSFSRRIFQIINDVLTGALANVAYPLLSSMQEDQQKTREVYLSSTFLSTVLAFPMFVGLAVVAENLIPIMFGDQWRAAVPSLQAFCAIGMLSCIGILQASLVQAKGRADWWLWYQLVQQGSAIAVIIGFYQNGLTTVVAALALKTWLVWPFFAVISCRLIDLKPSTYIFQFIAPAIGCIAMAAVAISLESYTNHSSLILLVEQIAFGGLAYVVTVLSIAHRRIMNVYKTISTKKQSA